MTVIRWTCAFIDRPIERFERSCAFWTAVTGTRTSEPRGERGEFTTLLVEGADAFLKVQGVGGAGGAHLDFSVDDVGALLWAAGRLGATVDKRHAEWVVLRSPSGQPFCVAPWAGEQVRPPAVTGPDGTRSRLDQVCIDIAPQAYDAEVAFWRGLTGWAFSHHLPSEFSLLKPPAGGPVQILLQRLGTDRPTSAHLDLACSDVAAVRSWHEQLGASTVGPGRSWTVMRDPAGGVYCLTKRSP